MDMSAPCMMATLQGHLLAEGLPDPFTISMHSFRLGDSLSKSLAGMVVDEIMKIRA